MSRVAITNERVQQILNVWLDEEIVMNETGGFVIPHESTGVFVIVMDLSDESSMVVVSAPVAFNVPMTGELCEWVALNTDGYSFGHIGLYQNDDGTGNVVFRHSLLGDFLDAEELKTTVTSVAMTADELVTLCSRFGGTMPTDA